ncbi:MAG: hypothetical protein CML13_07245 [Puniceicoccaceae bacterium]|nr:hypothetical protein [Puniceicoccaceae bacterium]|tara:strand:- start:32 stop:445 length:414 start_codon:yes stop_codon:yes gene_type:complete
MIKPTVLLFDVNETLLDLRPLRKSIGRALGGREDLLPLWFSTMLHYSLVETLPQDFHGFGEIGTAALRMLAETQQIELSAEAAQVLMVAAHAWDLAGAKKLGLQTAFIQRPGTALYPNTDRPDYVLRDLTELAQRLA